jgi:hypothetical protein
MKVIAFFLVAVASVCSSRAQVTIVQSYKIDALLNKHQIINQTRKTTPGWRVQINSTTEKNRAYQLKSELYKIFPDLPSYVSYWQPSFRLRAGDFRTRLEAYKWFLEIQPHFPDAQLVPDEVYLEPALD